MIRAALFISLALALSERVVACDGARVERVAAASLHATSSNHVLEQQSLYRHAANRMSMACVYAIEAYGSDAKALPTILDEALDEVDRIDRLMSHYKADSALSLLNREASRGPVKVDTELFDFIAEAMRYQRESGGAFDITVGPLMKTWGFFRDEGRVPTDHELADARLRVGGARVVLNAEEKTIAFDRAGVELDLGGIAKGYAVDRVVALLRARRIAAALISAGGSTIYGLGAPPGREAWDVDIQDPTDSRKTALTVHLKDRALSVAGSTEKSFEAGGVTYSHIMDPRTGTPVQGVLNVAVLTSSGTAGDALDNAFFVLGLDDSQAYLNNLRDTEAFFWLSGPSSAPAGPPRHLRSLQAQRAVVDLEAMPFAAKRYIVYRTASDLKVDGRLDEPSWSAVPWTDAFVDIEGDSTPARQVRAPGTPDSTPARQVRAPGTPDRRPAPRFRTRVKMLWDDDYFYIGAELEEPDVWATLTERDSVIFRDNDFEVFIDPDGDTHAYYELEVNALNTLWDLMLIKPYRDGGPAINGWDIAGLQSAVEVRGTINRPGDKDEGWSVEIAMPWNILREASASRKTPQPGDRWRVNFSRVQWEVDVVEGRYVKRLKPGSTDPLPEHNWVWSPQGAINMHMPERWGYVQFSRLRAGRETEAFVADANEPVKWALRRLYYRQRAFRDANPAYAATLDALGPLNIRVEGIDFRPVMQSTRSLYEITATGFDGGVVHIDQDGRVWITR